MQKCEVKCLYFLYKNEDVYTFYTKMKMSILSYKNEDVYTFIQNEDVYTFIQK